MPNLDNKRKDHRKYFKKYLPIDVDCQTIDSKFCASALNMSQTGAFIKTENHLSAGQEIALIFRFPDDSSTIKTTGEIIRANHSGVGVKFRIFFNY